MKKILIAASMILLGTTSIYALGTGAGTPIENNATLSYSAGGVSQPDINTTVPDVFVVDRKIDMILETDDSEQIEVTPGQTGRITNFTFKNESNADQNFTFSARDLTSADTSNGEADYNDIDDNQSVSNFVIACTGGDPDPATSAVDGTITVDVDENSTLDCTVSVTIKTIPQGAADGDIMNIELKAVAVKPDGSVETETDDGNGNDRQNVVDVVFADGVADALGTDTLGDTADSADDNSTKSDTVRDGADAARSGYIIQTPVLSVTKTSCVLADPVNGTSANAKRIPGAIVRYMLTVKNTGSADVSGLSISDKLNERLDYSSVTTPALNVRDNVGDGPSACDCKNPANGTNDHSETNSGADPVVKINNINVAEPAGAATVEQTCVFFEVTIK